MKAKLSHYYRKSGNRTVFVYTVLGTAEEKEKYLETQKAATNRSEWPVDGNGNPLFFSTRPLSEKRNEELPLTITANGKVVVDDLDRVLKNATKLDDYVMREQAKLMARTAIGAGGIDALMDLTEAKETENVEADTAEAAVNEPQA